jgi:putative PIN family toxin of toxin-antitoxin system
MRVVLDCNVVIAAARTDGVCRAVVLDVIRHHELVLSEPILQEYRSVGARPRHRAHRAVIQAIADLLDVVALVVEPLAERFEVADADDEMYVATAIAGDAHALITGNVRHFAGRYGTLEVITPRQFQALYMQTLVSLRPALR